MGSLVGSNVGRFRVDRELGRGGMGAVYAAFDERLEREVALKVLLANESDQDEKRRFIREARLAAKLTHPNIASVYEVDQIDGRIVIIMELLEGEPLRKLLATRRLDIEEAVSIARDIARALARAHASGIVHRDIKPENVFVTEPAPGALHAKVLDFGLARQRDPAMSIVAHEDSTMSQTWGTPGYMSPEQANRESVDARTDVFAFGALFYEMLAGIRAFRAANELGLVAAVLRSEPRSLAQINPEIPATLEDIVTRCLKKDRTARFTDGREVSAALEAFARPISTGGYRAIDPSRISSPDLERPPSSPNLGGGRISTPGAAYAPVAPPSAPALASAENAPSHGSVTATKKDVPSPFALLLDFKNPTVRKGVAIGGGIAALLILIIVVALAASGPSTSKPAVAASASPPPSTSFTTEPLVIPPPPEGVSSSESVEVDDTPPAAPPVHTAGAAPRPAKTGGTKAKPADCKTPFIIDSKGVKIPKMHCL